MVIENSCPNVSKVEHPREFNYRKSKAGQRASIREVLYRDLYRGVIVWNKTRKRNTWGLERRSVKAATDWITIEAPQFRIVTEAQWLAAHGRLEQTRQTYLRRTHGHLWGRPADGHESKYLLTGLSRCGLCGGTLIVRSRAHGSPGHRRRVYFYACSSFYHRGRTVCANSLEMRVQDADHALLTALERELLDPEILEAAMARAASRVAAPPEDLETRRHTLEITRTHAETALARLTQAVASPSGTEPGTGTGPGTGTEPGTRTGTGTGTGTYGSSALQFWTMRISPGRNALFNMMKRPCASMS